MIYQFHVTEEYAFVYSLTGYPVFRSSFQKLRLQIANESLAHFKKPD